MNEHDVISLMAAIIFAGDYASDSKNVDADTAVVMALEIRQLAGQRLNDQSAPATRGQMK